MANTIARLMVRIGGDISALERSLSKASRKIQDTGKQMQAMGRTMTTRISAPLAAVGGIALKTSAEFESLRQSMDILNGSVAEGARNFQRLKEFSATTPFQLNDLAQAQNMLQGFGLSADDAFDSLSMIGDIAAVAEGNIQGIGIAFGQAAAEGRLMTRDIRQLINQGVPAIKLLADTMGVAQSEVLDLASQGEISFEILQKAFREATSEGGLFADGMAKQAQTLGGVFSTMKDNVNIALASVGDTMSSLAKNMMQQVISLSQAFEALNQSTKQMIVTAGLLVAAIGPAIWIVGKLTVVIGALLSPISLAVAAIAGLIVIGKNMYDNWELIAANLEHLWQGIKLAAWTIVDGIFSAFQWMSTNILDVLSKMASVASPTLVAPLEAAKGQIKLAGEAINQTLQESRNEFDRLGKGVEEARKDIVTLGDSFWSIMDAIEGGIGSGLGWLSDTIFPEVQKETEKTTVAMNRLSNAMTVPSGSLQKVEQQYDSIGEAMGTMSDKAEIMGDALQTSVTSAITGFAETLGNVFTGDAGASGFFNNLILIVVDFLNQFGKLLVAAGIAALAFKKLLANPVAAIIAGGSLIAITTAIRNMLSNTPEMAQGGLAFGPTLAVVGDNRNARNDPEVIAPLSKLQGMMGGQTVKVEGEIRNEVIRLSNILGANKFR